MSSHFAAFGGCQEGTRLLALEVLVSDSAQMGVDVLALLESDKDRIACAVFGAQEDKIAV